jgi:SAM-dependent methyltransferase
VVELDDLKANWEEFGRTIPMRSILWRQEPWEPEDFFASGRQQVEGSLTDLAQLGIRPRGRALDFGCGLGRLSQGLAHHFGDVIGVDIAASMIEQARTYNREYNPYAYRCRFFVNTTDDLSQFGKETFDFVYSLIVLQHVGTEPAKRYLREFLRILQPGGVALFQLPSEMIAVRGLPAAGRRGAVSLDPDLPPELATEAGSSVSFSVHVRNTSDCDWEPEHGVTLAGVWRRPGSDDPVDDQGPWFPISALVTTSQSVELPVIAGVPAAPGDYLLELVLHQARLGAFPSDGCQAITVPVRVERRDAETLEKLGVPATAPAGTTAHMEMHGVPREDVLAIVASAGASVVAVTDDALAGPDWRSYVYLVEKSSGPLQEHRRRE